MWETKHAYRHGELPDNKRCYHLLLPINSQEHFARSQSSRESEGTYQQPTPRCHLTAVHFILCGILPHKSRFDKFQIPRAKSQQMDTHDTKSHSLLLTTTTSTLTQHTVFFLFSFKSTTPNPRARSRVSANEDRPKTDSTQLKWTANDDSNERGRTACEQHLRPTEPVSRTNQREARSRDRFDTPRRCTDVFRFA